MTRLPSLHLERLTSPEVGRALSEGMTTVVFACGAVEQHGPHLAMCMDAENGTRLAEEVARRLGNALVAPTIRVGCSEHHMSFPGSLTLSPATFEAVCRDYCGSLARHGFRRILIVPSHGGNFHPLRDMLPRLREAAGPATEVRLYADLMEFIAVWRGVIEEMSGLGDRVGGHADIAETAVMLALHPELVRPDRAEEGYRGEVTEAVLARVMRDGLHTITPNGIIGDARGATAAMGERCLAALADRIADHFGRA
jgi:creatinine amidohydrolase